MGLGASAGGLRALQEFFNQLPDNTGMAFVVITHLHPEHESHLAELLQSHTSMPVSQVMSRVPIEANRIYVIPPNRRIIVADSKLDVAEFEEPRGKRTPIDQFFRSLAKAHPNAVAIILSGGGTDGSVGIKDIKENGGLLMVQDPDDAEYDSMPRAAITTGLADVVLPVGELAEKLVEFTKVRLELPQYPDQLTEQEKDILQRILAQVHARTGHDFSQYKRTTVLRRLQRRMQLNGLSDLNKYLDYLRHNVNEAASIFNDILIGVTNFFRDRSSWERLEKTVIPALFLNKDNGEPIRVWSIGCSTGEEAYTLGILLLEHAKTLDTQYSIQVFASDIDENSLSRARQGIYPSAIEADVSPERLERYFTQQGNHYQVKRELRDMVLFSAHSVLRDPPFSRLDLVSCRNLLIYVQREMQDNIFDIFHYALNPGGFLFLGNAESAEMAYELFEAQDKQHRIFKTKPWRGERPRIPSLPLNIRNSPRHPSYVPPRFSFGTQRFDQIPSLGEQHLAALETYGPPSILVNQEHAILHISETAGRYLLQPAGPITSDLLKLVRKELQSELRSALFQSFDKEKAVVSHPIPVQFNGDIQFVTISVRPRRQIVHRSDEVERVALVVFLEDELKTPEAKTGAETDSRVQVLEESTIRKLEYEVQHLREQLQSTVEEYDSSNEEMKAANEELQSINEEYRSATEELETSKEELQSVNEELQTVNNELKSKLDEISRAHNDLENLMGATEIPTLFLDRDLRIQRFTSGMQNVFDFLESDRGRPINQLVNKLAYRDLIEDAQKVFRTLIPLEKEVTEEGGDWYLIRIRPYLTLDDRIDGVVITFVDITAVKKTQEELENLNETLEERVFARTTDLDEANRKLAQARDMFYTLFHANPIPTALTRLDGMVINVNIEFLRYFNMGREEIINRSIHELGYGLGLGATERADIPIQGINESNIRYFEMEIDHPSGGRRNLLASVQRIDLDGTQALISSFIDLTERVRAERQVRSLAADLTVAEQEERRRISQILHDDLQQRIFAVKIQLSTLQEIMQTVEKPTTQLDFAELQAMLDESIAITRNLSIDLSPAILQGDSLVDALNWLAAQMRDQYGLKVDVDPNGVSTRYEDTLRILLFQAVREALFNVVKHAGTLHAMVRFEEDESHARLTVTDDGKGFDMPASTLEQIGSGGLANFRHRLELMGCILQIQSASGNGTQVQIDIPTQGRT